MLYFIAGICRVGTRDFLVHLRRRRERQRESNKKEFVFERVFLDLHDRSANDSAQHIGEHPFAKSDQEDRPTGTERIH